jgi:hypothetical protein
MSTTQMIILVALSATALVGGAAGLVALAILRMTDRIGNDWRWNS